MIGEEAMTEHDWRKLHEKNTAKQADVDAKSSDWKAHRRAPTSKGNARVSKAAWTKRKRSA
jgi:hypothetical protein